MSSFWTKAAKMAADSYAGSDALGGNFPAQELPRASIRRDSPPPPHSAIPTEDDLELRLAEELDYARRLLDCMGDALSADTFIVRRHLAELQTVDIVGQMLGHIASVVRSSDRVAAVEAIGMTALKGRLLRKNQL